MAWSIKTKRARSPDRARKKSSLQPLASSLIPPPLVLRKVLEAYPVAALSQLAVFIRQEISTFDGPLRLDSDTAADGRRERIPLHDDVARRRDLFGAVVLFDFELL